MATEREDIVHEIPDTRIVKAYPPDDVASAVEAALAHFVIAFPQFQEITTVHVLVWTRALDSIAPDVITEAADEVIRTLTSPFGPTPARVREVALAIVDARKERDVVARAEEEQCR